MNPEIHPASSSGMQADWAYNATHCGRVPSDYGVPIICTLSSFNFTAPPSNSSISTHSSLSTNNALSEKYEQCCPKVANGTNIWVNRRECTLVCYTYNENLHFADCVRHIKAKEGNSTADYGSCFFINYEKLKKGVQSISAGERFGTSALRVLAMVMFAGAVGSAV